MQREFKPTDKVRVSPTDGDRGFYATVVRVGRRWVHVCGVRDGLTCGRYLGPPYDRNPCDIGSALCGRFDRSELELMETFGGVVVFPPPP